MFEIAEEQTYEDGQIIWEDGSFGDWFCVVESGAVELYKMVKGEKVVIEVLQKGEIIGEIAYITKGPRTFTARASGPTTLGIIDREFLDQEYNRMSESFKIILKSLALRLKKTSENAIFGRKSPRVLKSLSLIFKSRESLIKAFSANASEGGLLIKTPKPLAKGERFLLKLQLPEDTEPLKIECEVAWSRTETNDPVRQPVGMGVKFLEISNANRQRLEAELHKADPAIKLK